MTSKEEPGREVVIGSPNPIGGCFFCGRNNPIGPRLSFNEGDGSHKELVCHWTPPVEFQGQGDILHGGIQSGLMDEIMGWTSFHFSGRPGVTKGFEVRFLAPLYVEEPLTLHCRVIDEAKDHYDLEAWIENSDDSTCATARGAYKLVSMERFNRLTRRG